MLYKIAKAFTFLIAVYKINRFLFGGSKDRIVDSIAGAVLLGMKGSSDEVFYNQYTTDIQSSDKKIANIDFEANMEIGIKQKSRNVGQILDYIRLSGKNFNLLPLINNCDRS